MANKVHQPYQAIRRASDNSVMINGNDSIYGLWMTRKAVADVTPLAPRPNVQYAVLGATNNFTTMLHREERKKVGPEKSLFALRAKWG